MEDVVGETKHQIKQGPRINEDDFKIVEMTIKDANNKGKILWQVKQWGLQDSETEKKVEFPAEMLNCTALSREIVFFSKQKIDQFKIIQRMSLHGQVVEFMEFKFGFVIPNSTNSWDQTIEADVGAVMPASVLSGNLVVDTFFMSGDEILAQTKYRIYYI